MKLKKHTLIKMIKEALQLPNPNEGEERDFLIGDKSRGGMHRLTYNQIAPAYIAWMKTRQNDFERGIVDFRGDPEVFFSNLPVPVTPGPSYVQTGLPHDMVRLQSSGYVNWLLQSEFAPEARQLQLKFNEEAKEIRNKKMGFNR